MGVTMFGSGLMARAGKAVSIEDLIERYRTNEAVSAAAEHERVVSHEAQARNEAYQKREGGTTESDPRVEKDVFAARLALQQARQAASNDVRPGFTALQRAAAAAMVKALDDVVKQRHTLARVEDAATSCGVRLPSLLTSALPDDLAQADWLSRVRAAGIDI